MSVEWDIYLIRQDDSQNMMGRHDVDGDVNRVLMIDIAIQVVGCELAEARGMISSGTRGGFQ